MPLDNETLITLTGDIVAAHVSHNNVPVEKMAGVIESVFAALQGLGAPVEPVVEKPVGAVSVRASIKPGHLVSMIDGKPYKMLKRHLSINGYTPESYRETFNLPRDYPMVATEYAEKRRGLAMKIGLGRKPKVEAKPAKKPRAPKAAKAATTAPAEAES
jgi:predicted transcriptional regulator